MGDGRNENRNGDRARQERDANKNFWKDKAAPIEVGMRSFRLTLKRGTGLRDTNLSPLATGFSWEDAGPILMGDLTLQMPKSNKGPEAERPNIRAGDLVVCEVSEKGHSGHKPVWKMRVEAPSWEVGDGSFSCVLADEMSRLQKSRDDFKYKKDHSHPNGWKAHQVTEDVCRKYGVPMGKIKKGTHKFKKIVKQDTSPLDVIQYVYKEERYKEGARAIIRFREGALEVVPMKRSPFLLRLGDTLMGASLTARERDKNFATKYEVTVAADGKKGKRDKAKIETTVEADGLRSRFGLIVKQIELDEAESEADAEKQAKRMMVEAAETERDLVLTHPGVPSVFRGDAIQVQLPYEGFRRKVLYIKEVRHSVSPGTYDMELTLSFDDPYENAKQQAECEKRCKKAREQGRKAPQDCNCPEQKKNRPSGADQHDNAPANEPSNQRKGAL